METVEFQSVEPFEGRGSIHVQFLLDLAMQRALSNRFSEGGKQFFRLVFGFLLICPGMAFVRLLRLKDRFAEFMLAVALSLIPITAPITMPLRAAFTEVPPWQIIASLALLVASAFGSLWLAGRTFRLGMLRYGKRLTWREVFRKAS